MFSRGSAAGCAPTASRRRRAMPLTGNSVVLSSSGASGERRRRDRGRTGVEAHDGVGLLARREQRVPVVGVHRRQPEVVGFSGKLTALKPARRVAAHLLGRDVRVAQPGDLQRDDPLGVRARPHVVVPVVPRAHAREPELLVVGCARTSSPANPASNDGKHSDAQMPARSMSAMRAWMSQQPLRISSKRAGSMLHSSFGRPTTALSPMFGIEVVLEDPLLAPSSLDHARRGVDERRGHPALEEVGRLDEVVVDRDDRVAPRARRRVGQQRHGRCSARRARAGAGVDAVALHHFTRRRS